MEHRVDQRQVREGLREVAQVPAVARIDLLRIEPQRAGVGQELLQQVVRAVGLADLRQRRDQPERTDRERALLAAQPVVRLVDAVPKDQAVGGQLVGDRQDRVPDARIVRREESNERRQQERRVQRLRSV